MDATKVMSKEKYMELFKLLNQLGFRKECITASTHSSVYDFVYRTGPFGIRMMAFDGETHCMRYIEQAFSIGPGSMRENSSKSVEFITFEEFLKYMSDDIKEIILFNLELFV